MFFILTFLIIFDFKTFSSPKYTFLKAFTHFGPPLIL